MNIGGWQKVTLVDFPGKIATIVFTNGCVFRCGFCYNPDLVIGPFPATTPEDEFFAFLDKRKGKLEGVVITGGEPTMQGDLISFMEKIKAKGFAVKLDTCGYLPDRVKTALESGFVDYVAMDIKAPLEKYSMVTNIQVQTERIKESIKLIMESGIPYEFRSTLVAGVHELDDIIKMARLIEGADKYYLQRFLTTEKLIDPAFKEKTAPPESLLNDVLEKCRKYVTYCEIRING